GLTMDARPARNEPLLPNVGYVARREYAALVRGRLFFVSTVVLAGLAMFVAFLPVAAKLIDRGSQTTVVVVSEAAALPSRTRGGPHAPEPPSRARGVLQGILDQSGGGFALTESSDRVDALARVDDRQLDAV